MNWIDVRQNLPTSNIPCIVWVDNKVDKVEGFERVVFNTTNKRFIKVENEGEYETDLTDYITHWTVLDNPNNNPLQSLYNTHKLKLNNLKEFRANMFKGNYSDIEINLVEKQIELLASILSDIYKGFLQKTN